MASDRLPILLTAAVATHGMKGADFTDAQRETMYADTLAFYHARLPADVPFVFVENSGWDLSRLRSRAPCTGRTVEWLAVRPALSDLSRGKGYNEILMISEAMEKSVALRAAGAFLKVTGRYPVSNLAYFLAEAERRLLREGADYYGDMKDHRVYDCLHTGWNGHAAYTVLFATTCAFYRRVLAETYRACDDARGAFVECVWYRVLVTYRHHPDARVSLRFRREPVLGGLQGSNLDALSFCKSNDSPRARLQRLIGNLIRRFLPGFWF